MIGYLRQATASQTRMIGPFVDDTDFKTVETGLTIGASDIKLSKNAAAAVNKNSGGATHVVNGNYGVTFDAVDTGSVGELHVSVVVAGALLVVAKFIVLEEVVYDALFAPGAVGFASSAQVNAQVLDVIDVDTFALPGQGTPPAVASIRSMIAYLYKAWRNKTTNNGAQTEVFADDGTTVDHKATTGDSAGTFTKGKYTTGP